MNSYSEIQGFAVVDGYQPDGDTIRFVPDQLVEITRLSRGHLATPGADTSVPIRLEGIDAPELHFEGREQPAAKPALDALLAAIGWPPPASAKLPRGVRVRVVARSCDAHGRVIGYLMPAGASSRLEDSVNASLLAAGLVYPLAYASEPAAHRESFGKLALAAREAARGGVPRVATRGVQRRRRGARRARGMAAAVGSAGGARWAAARGARRDRRDVPGGVAEEGGADGVVPCEPAIERGIRPRGRTGHHHALSSDRREWPDRDLADPATDACTRRRARDRRDARKRSHSS